MIQDSIVVPAGHGAAFPMRAGASVAIENTHGTQVVDTWAVAAADPCEYGSMEHTRSANSNIFVEAGMVVVSIHRRPMLTVVSDTTPGRHDTQLCPCNAAIYRELKHEGPHRSCTDNFHEALAEQGVALPFTPASLNLFMNVPIAEDGGVQRLPPVSKPGDRIVLRAEMDLILVLSACPQDITPINGAEHTPRNISVYLLDAPLPKAAR